MRILTLICGLLICFSCKNNSKEPVKNDRVENEKSSKHISDSFESYKNDQWSFSLKYPENFILLESKLPGDAPVINLYSKDGQFHPPFAIHEEPENAYIAILPKGFGVDGPSGKQVPFSTIEEVNFDAGINLHNSKAYLLESGEAWAYFLRFKNAPGNWAAYGGLFVHFPIKNFDARCMDSSGNQKELNTCDPMGNDEILYSGKIDARLKSQMINILETFQFKSKTQKPVSDLIQVESPQPSMEVSSPLYIKGKARGYWFFEANAPIEIQDKDHNTLARSYIKADGEWMTEDFVSFSGNIEFKTPGNERGYLVFSRANPSDKKENDRQFRIPVIFPPK